MLPFYCEYDTREKCRANSKKVFNFCNKIHFVPQIEPHTIPSLGDCSYLDTCKSKKQCRYIHYSTECPPTLLPSLYSQPKSLSSAEWINCDVLK